MTDLTIPAFWRKRTFLSFALLPLAWLYRFLHNIKFNHTDIWVAPRPVICIGNLMLGGSGKTPLVLSIAHKLEAQGLKVGVLSRGYRGQLTDATKVDIAVHSALDVGDEALMIANYVDCFIGRDKVQLAKLAIRAGADILLMDDGFQNPSLYQNLRIVVIDGQVGFGNGLGFPSGPMRESIKALQRASWVVMMGEDKHQIFPLLKKHKIDVLRARTVPSQITEENKKWLAFAGIGFPEKFFYHLSLTGYNVAHTKKFPNHHMMSYKEIMGLLAEAKSRDLSLITTEKDWMRLPRIFRRNIKCHRIELIWEQDAEMNKRLSNFVYFTDCMV